MQENYPRVLLEIYKAQVYGDQMDNLGIETQFAGYGQGVAQNNNEVFPKDQNQKINFEGELGRLINIQGWDQVVPEEQLFEEEYSPPDDGDFFADDEKFPGEPGFRILKMYIHTMLAINYLCRG